VYGVCTSVKPFEHFSLAPFRPIGDNPALSDSGGTRGRQILKGRPRGDRGKHDAPVRA